MRIMRLAGAAVLALSVGACGAASTGQRAHVPQLTAQRAIGPSEGELNLVIRAGYAEDGSTHKGLDWVHPFERQTGCKVHATVADAADSMVALLINSGKFDGVSASGYAARQLIYQGAVVPVNTKLLTYYRDLPSFLRNQPYNSVNGQMYGMPEGYGANLLLYRTDKIPQEPTSWSVVWDKNSPAASRIVDYDTPTYIADAALYLKAHRPDLKITDIFELTQPQFMAAIDLLKQQRPLVNQYWSNQLDEIQSFKMGDDYAGSGWQVNADKAKAQGVPIATTIPKEGVTGWAFSWLVARRAVHPNCMYKWMNWVTSPKIQAEASQAFGQTPANPKACEYASKSFCAEYHVGDPDFYRRISFWKAPLADCGDSRGTVCVDASKWAEYWSQVKG